MATAVTVKTLEEPATGATVALVASLVCAVKKPEPLLSEAVTVAVFFVASDRARLLGATLTMGVGVGLGIGNGRSFESAPAPQPLIPTIPEQTTSSNAAVRVKGRSTTWSFLAYVRAVLLTAPGESGEI